mgnify:CR=1 FL=1
MALQPFIKPVTAHWVFITIFSSSTPCNRRPAVSKANTSKTTHIFISFISKYFILNSFNCKTIKKKKKITYLHFKLLLPLSTAAYIPDAIIHCIGSFFVTQFVHRWIFVSPKTALLQDGRGWGFNKEQICNKK